MNSTRAGSILALAAGICACADDARAQGSVAQDRAALIAFYDVVDVQEWDDDENWASDAPLGKWSGVTTDESGRVTKLEVPTFWATRGQQDRVAGEAPAPLTVEILRNAEYQWVDWPTSLEPAPGGKAKLTDGRFVTLVPEARHVYYLELMDRVAFGDLNGDGIDDAVVFLRANGGGGNHEGLYLTAVVNEQGQPRHVDSRYLGDSRGGPESLEVEDGHIVVQKWAYGRTDAQCCPSQKETFVFQLAGDTLSFIDSPEPVQAGLGNSVLEPDEIRNVEPLYPAEAFQEGLEGVVVLEVVVGTTGFVTDARVLRSAPRFDGAAIAAVKQWQYVPTVLGGTPVPVTFTVVVSFRLR